jgi:hypothetical protein
VHGAFFVHGERIVCPSMMDMAGSMPFL